MSKNKSSRRLRMPLSPLLCICLIFTFIGGCAESSTEAAEMLKSMTLREKVGQLFIIRIESLDESLSSNEAQAYYDNGITEFSAAIGERLKEYPAGGIALFGKNIESPEQLSKLVSDIKTASKTSPFICIDEEGGLVARIARKEIFEVPVFPSASETAQMGVQAVRDEGEAIGEYLSKYGINVDFAPVTDVNSNPNNPVIGTRAFSSNPNEVAEMAKAFLSGLHSRGVMGCIKHFPGHGDTDSDTHTGAAVINKGWEELLKCELIPFMALMPETDMIMTAHISLPQITGDDTPATMSYTILTEKLRNELGYDGVVITDSLAMGAITEKYDSVEMSVNAILAGADILLMPYNYSEAFDGVLAAVENGTISEERLDESVLRILRLKEKLCRE